MSDRLLDFVSARADARPLALVRIGGGIGALAAVLQWNWWFRTVHSDPSTWRVPYVDGIGVLPQATWGAFAFTGVCAALFLILGLWARLGAGVLVLQFSYLLLLDQTLYRNQYWLAFHVVLLLAVSRCDATFALGRPRQAGAVDIPAWPVRLLALLLPIVYGFTTAAKLNPEFFTGLTMAGKFGVRGLLHLPAGFTTAEALRWMAVVTVLVEGFLAVAFATRRCLAGAYVVGAALHGGILLIMPLSAIWTVEFAILGISMLSLYVLTLPHAPAAALVEWDPACPTCSRWVHRLQRLDWLGAHEFASRSEHGSGSAAHPAAACGATCIRRTSAAGRETGFAALRGVLEAVPAGFLWAPLLRVPGLRALGAWLAGRGGASRSVRDTPDPASRRPA